MDKEAFNLGATQKKYKVNSTCIDCDLCEKVAPNNFKRNISAGVYYISKQPTNAKEAIQCAKAKKECPVNAIE